MSEAHGRPGARSIAFILTAWAVTAALGMLIASVLSTSPPAVGGLGPANWARPLIDGHTTTLAAAESAAGYTIPFPATAAASQSNLTQVWESPNNYVALVFADGKVTLLIRPATYTDAAAWFTMIVAGSPGSAAVGQVNGQPAVLIQPDTDPYGPNPAWVEFYRNGLDINVISTSYGTDTLLSIADSVQ